MNTYYMPSTNYVTVFPSQSLHTFSKNAFPIQPHQDPTRGYLGNAHCRHSDKSGSKFLPPPLRLLTSSWRGCCTWICVQRLQRPEDMKETGDNPSPQPLSCPNLQVFPAESQTAQSRHKPSPPCPVQIPGPQKLCL